MTVEDDHGVERGMAAHANGEMPPVSIPNMEVVVVDERIGLLAADVDPVVAVALNVPHGGRGAAHQDAEDLGARGIGRQLLFANGVFALTRLTIEDRNPLLFSPPSDATAKASCQTHQVRVVEVVVRAVQISPPDAKAPGVWA